MTLIQAFQDRTVSASLISRWEAVNSPEIPRSVYDEYVMRKVKWIMLSVFSILCLTIIVFRTKTAGIYLEFSIICLVLIAIFCVFSLMSRQDKKCVKDCQELGLFIHEASKMSLEDLMLQSSRTLVDLAGAILRVEISLSKETAEEKRSGLENACCVQKESFKRAHTIFLKFGLVEKKWDSYFRDAKERMEHSSENDPVVAPTGT